jgi:hypothetical protein
MSDNIKDPKTFRTLLESFDTPYRMVREEYNEAAQEVEQIQQEMAQLLDDLVRIIRSELPDQYPNLDAYLIAPLKVHILGDESGYMSRDTSISTVISMLEGDDSEDEEF